MLTHQKHAARRMYAVHDVFYAGVPALASLSIVFVFVVVVAVVGVALGDVSSALDTRETNSSQYGNSN
jgi:hypothetical protein